MNDFVTHEPVGKYHARSKGMEKHVNKQQGKMLAVSLTPELDTVKGEAGMCYLEPGIKSYTREIRFRKPATILIIDRITAAKPVKLDWFLHARVPFNIKDQHNVMLSTDHAEMQGGLPVSGKTCRHAGEPV